MIQVGKGNCVRGRCEDSSSRRIADTNLFLFGITLITAGLFLLLDSYVMVSFCK
jgi:hypothetical protein